MARRLFMVDEVRHGIAEITGDEAAHMTRVLRVEPGEKVEVSDNQSLWLAEVIEAHRTRVRVQVLERLNPGPTLPPVHLYAALFKFDRFEWLVEKATELGVARIVPVETARSERGLFAAAGKRAERWRRIAREASQQCRRTTVPLIGDPIPLREVEASGPRLRLDEAAGVPPLKIPAEWDREQPLAVILGPEGGWTEEERASLDHEGWTGASIAHTTLRAETAGMAALSILSHAWISRPS